MYIVSLKDHCKKCESGLYYKFPYIKARHLSTELLCKRCNTITTYFEIELKAIYNQMIKDLRNTLFGLPIRKEKLREEYIRIQKLYLTNGDQKYQTKLDILRTEIFV